MGVRIFSAARSDTGRAPRIGRVRGRAFIKRVVASLNLGLPFTGVDAWPSRSFRRPPRAQRPVFEALEPRLLLSGSGLLPTAALAALSAATRSVTVPLVAGVDSTTVGTANPAESPTLLQPSTDSVSLAVSTDATTTGPVIASVSLTAIPINGQSYYNWEFTITGGGFGSQSPFNGDSSNLLIYDATAGWGAGYSGSNDAVTANVVNWSDTQIQIDGLTGGYGSGSWVISSGDALTVQIANPSTGQASNIYQVAAPAPQPGVGQWSTSSLPSPGGAMRAISVGQYVVLSGGSYYTSGGWAINSSLEIYNTGTDQWSATVQPDATVGAGWTAVGDELIIAGGASYSNGAWAPTAAVNTYNVSTGQWSSAPALSQARYGLAAGTVGSLAIFAGGATYSDGTWSPSSDVDIYNTSTGTWSTATLSVARWFIAATTVGDLAIFAGGTVNNVASATPNTTAAVDIYNANNGKWSTALLSQARSSIAATTVGDDAIFAGGQTHQTDVVTMGNWLPPGVGGYAASGAVDIYNLDTNQWTTAAVPQAAGEMSAVTSGDLAFFAGGDTESDAAVGNYTGIVNIFDVTTNQWSFAELSQPRYGMASASVGDLVMFAGGEYSTAGNAWTPTNVIDWCNVTNSAVPAITNATPGAIPMSGGGYNWSFAVTGGGFGSNGTGADLVLSDSTAGWSTDSKNGVTANIASGAWSATSIAISNLGGNYGTGTYFINPGDNLTLTVVNPDNNQVSNVYAFQAPSVGTSASPPKITGVTATAIPVSGQSYDNWSFAIQGSNFGTQNAFNGDSPDLWLEDFNASFNAGHSYDWVTADVTSWTPNSIQVASLGGEYGQQVNETTNVLSPNDPLSLRVVNPGTGLSSQVYQFTISQGHEPPPASELATTQVLNAYGFNQLTTDSAGNAYTGQGQTIAVIGLTNDLNLYADVNAFDYNMKAANGDNLYGTYGGASTWLTVTDQNGNVLSPGQYNPDTENCGNDSGDGLENVLDVEWAHAVAPAAKIVVVEEDSSAWVGWTWRGLPQIGAYSPVDLANAVKTALNFSPSVVSMSLGWREWNSSDSLWGGATETSLDSAFATSGVTFVAAAGDQWNTVNWPSASGNVLSVGGTVFNGPSATGGLDAAGDYPSGGESAWHDGNGPYQGTAWGTSQYEPQPSYQQGANGLSDTSDRSTPDVSYCAKPYAIYTSSGWEAVLGTSAGAPQWAGLIALADQGRADAGLPTLTGNAQTLPALYTASASDFYLNSAGSQYAKYGYQDETGLGTPKANLLVPYLAAYSAAQSPAISGVAPGSPTEFLWYYNDDLTISGSGFGSQAAFDGTSPYIDVYDVTQDFHAGGTGDAVGLEVTNWTDSELTVAGFSGWAYGDWPYQAQPGDTIEVTVSNPGTGLVSNVATAILPALGPGSTTPSGLTPTQMREAYGLGAYGASTINFGGTPAYGQGQTIAIVDAYNDPYIVADANAFSAEFGLPQFGTAGGPTLSVVNQDGGSSELPSDGGSWTSEESLDVEWAHVIAPDANIVLVEANSSAGDLYTAVQTAASLNGVVAVSMSWGEPESDLTTLWWSYEPSYDKLLVTPPGHTGGSGLAGGVTFLASTGDQGAPGNYPAYSPNVVAVGGTTLTVNANGSGGYSWGGEVGWSLGSDSWNPAIAGGGGISQSEPQPAYQSGKTNGLGSGYRTTPDVSMDADPATGVPIYDSYDYGSAAPWINREEGGTSLACPMWAGLVALVDQGRASLGDGSLSSGQTLSALYNLPSTDFHDITSGYNGYYAGPGYDLVTGLGSPIANLLVPGVVSATAVPQSSQGTSRTHAGSLNSGYGPAAQVGVPLGRAGAGVAGNGSALAFDSAIGSALARSTTSGAVRVVASFGGSAYWILPAGDFSGGPISTASFGTVSPPGASPTSRLAGGLDASLAPDILRLPLEARPL